MEFSDWNTLYAVREKKYKRFTWNEFYLPIVNSEGFEKAHDTTTDGKTRSFYNRALIEGRWYHIGQPYFKLWPKLAGKLIKKKLDMPMSTLKLPYDTFSIRLPNNTEIPTVEDLSTILVSSNEEDDGCIIICYRLKNGKGGMATLLAGAHNMLIKDGLAKLKTNNPDPFNGMRYSLENIGKLVVATCFFGTDIHELVAPEIKRKDLVKYVRARNNNDKTEAQKYIDRARKAGLFGYNLGAEYDLPRPNIEYVYLTENPKGKGVSKQFKEFVRGHFWMKPCGPGKKDRELDWRRAHVRGANKPMNPNRHGYRIGRVT